MIKPDSKKYFGTGFCIRNCKFSVHKLNLIIHYTLTICTLQKFNKIKINRKEKSENKSEIKKIPI